MKLRKRAKVERGQKPGRNVETYWLSSEKTNLEFQQEKILHCLPGAEGESVRPKPENSQFQPRILALQSCKHLMHFIAAITPQRHLRDKAGLTIFIPEKLSLAKPAPPGCS